MIHTLTDEWKMSWRKQLEHQSIPQLESLLAKHTQYCIQRADDEGQELHIAHVHIYTFIEEELIKRGHYDRSK